MQVFALAEIAYALLSVAIHDDADNPFRGLEPEAMAQISRFFEEGLPT